ncbi:MAG: Gfo/Idh/MocA family oxidoreductase [Anaerolineales bacterium]|nr:Gfo/Idh/MocA family oxidoreductase [Anaerolineales bacterium]
MTRKLRIGFIGAGRMANEHAGLIHTEPDVDFVAASDTDAGRAEAFAAKWGCVAYTDHRLMLERERLDGVYICTPTPEHAAAGLDCAEHGVAMYIEKPLDLDLRAANRLVEEVERKGLIAVNALQWRYSEAFRRAEALIDGAPIALVNLRWYWTRPPIRWMWDRKIVGGQIVDQSIHLVDVARAIAGDITVVYAAYNERQVNQEDEFTNWDGYALTLHFARGAVGVCAGTYALFSQIQKEPAADFCLRDRMVRVTDKRVQLYTPTGVEEWANTVPLHTGVNRAFIEAVRTGDPASIRTPLRTGLETTAIVLAANRSAATGQPVTVADFLCEETA